jgi:cytochrome c2
MRKLAFLLFLTLVVSVVACGGDTAPSGGGGDAVAGEKVFNETSAPACNTCHSLESGKVLLGPSLAKIGAEAGSRVSGQSAEEYLRKSVTAPNDHVVDGFGANIMPATYVSQLSEQQINDLVAYMLTLK